jgi:transposase-like protein
MPEISTEKKLTPQRRRAIEALLTNGNVSQAADDAGVHRSTLYKWMADHEFRSALHDAEAEAVRNLSRTLAGLAAGAAAAFRDGLHESQDIKIRLRAAEAVASNLLRLRELVAFEERLSALEAAQRGKE